MKLLLLLCSTILLVISTSYSDLTTQVSPKPEYEKALVNYQDFEQLVKKVKKIREKNLISFEQLLQYQNEPNTIILDARSKDKYAGKHLKGAINLPFTEFTQENLRRVIPDTTTRIIIYCNNNFKGDPIYFASKMFVPGLEEARSLSRDKRPIMLALNIPTYINLYGYGYRNIFELNELVDMNDKRLTFERQDDKPLQEQN